MTRGRAGTVLDRALPAWDWNEYHSVEAAAAEDRMIDAVDALTWNDVPLFRRIMTTVSLGRVPKDRGARVLDFFERGPYVLAYRDSVELVYVGFLRPRHGPDILDFEGDPVMGFRDASPAGTVKVAMNFLHRDGLLSTETRCQAKDRFTACAFGVYWLLIRVGSGIIRRSWLKGILAEAKRMGQVRTSSEGASFGGSSDLTVWGA